VVKSKSINRLDDEILRSCLRVATSHIHPDIKNLVSKKQRQARLDVLPFFKIKPYVIKSYINILNEY
jgi:hypothetical protein